jgi:L-rhamnose isomerase
LTKEIITEQKPYKFFTKEVVDTMKFFVGHRQDGDLNNFLDKNGIHIDEYKETLYPVSFESFLPGPDFKEDEFKVDVFSVEGDPEDIIERLDGAVILLHMDLYAPDLKMMHVLSSTTDL